MRKIRLIVTILALAMLLGLAAFFPGPALSADTVTVYVDGRRISFPDAPAYVDENNRTQIPTRYIGEALGAEVEWDKTARRATFSLAMEPHGREGEARFVDFYIGSAVFYVKDSPNFIPERQTMDTAAIIGNGRTYVPVRFLAEALGATVRWDPVSRTVHVSSRSDPSHAESAAGGAVPLAGSPGDDAKYDEQGLYLAQYANMLYQQWFESLRITYEGEKVFISYTLPGGLPENTELRVALMCDVMKNGKIWDGLGWLYESFERGKGDREAGYGYLLPSPPSGDVKKELRYIPPEELYWIYISVNLVTPRNATAWEGSRYSQSFFRVNINAQDLKKSELCKNAHNKYLAEIAEYKETITIDGSAILRINN